MRVPLMTAAFLEIQTALVPLFDAFESEAHQEYLLAMVGYAPEAGSFASLRTLVQRVQTGYADLQTLLATPATSLADLQAQFAKVQNLLLLVADLQALLAPNAAAAPAAELVEALTVALFGRYLQGAHPTLYALLVLLEVVSDPADHEPEPAVLTANHELVRASYRAYHFHFDRLGALFSNPAGYVKQHYYPAGLPDRATANAVADKLFPRLGQLLLSLGLHASYGMSPNETLSYGPTSDELQRHMLTVVLTQGRVVAFGFTLALSSAQDGDLGLVVAPFGTATFHHDFEQWLVDILLSVSLKGFAIGPQGVLLDGGLGDFRATASARSHPDGAGSAFLFGAPEGTHLAIGEVAFEAGLRIANGQADYGVLAKASQAKFVLRPEAAGGFLGAIIPAGGVAGTFDLGLGWSKAKGFYLLGNAALKAHYTINNPVSDRLLVIRGVDVGLLASADKLRLSATASGRVQLGPVAAELTDIGAVADITFPGAGGNLGVANAAVSFQYPRGLGISVESDAVNGGGYLFFDPDNHRYAGVASLEIKAGPNRISATALGILQTELPGHPDDYSLLLLLTATFTPIQLGMGFTLNGLGGLVGINRQSNIDYLRGMVRQGQLKRLLFAQDVLDDPAGALALADAAFPVARGQHVIGLMAQLGWGSGANIITLDVAVLLELPRPVRMVLLGVLQAVLPSPENDKLKLRADFLGALDLGAKRAAFDASLTDSHLLSFALTGDLAFRLYQGANPLFVITAGGFHPAFQPPAGAGLTGLRRLGLGLSKGSLQLALASYFAVTANTVQFGARLDLVYKITRGFRVEGHFGFDVLFQFSPFRLLAHVEAGVAIKRGSSEYLSIHLALDVTGPGPWHVWGEASFRVLGFKIRFRVEATIGAAPAETTLPAPQVRELLVAALNVPASWEVEAPATALPGGVVLRPVAPTAGQLFLDPRGALALRQRVVPLGLTIDKYGSSPVKPVGGQLFELTHLQVGGTTYAAAPAGGPLEGTREFFAPDQFSRLTDAQKLSAPSFQLLPNGLRLKQLNGLVADPRATRRIIEYEKKLVSGASGGSQPPASPQAIDQTTYRQLTRGSALGRAVQQAQPSARAAQPLGWHETTYEVVDAATLDVCDAAHVGFQTQAEAEQYRQALLTAAATREVLVVPTYQLALA